MTREGWRTSDDPQAMLQAIHGRVSDRKLRLFACACCRDIWHLINDESSRKAVEAAELFADGKITPAAWAAARAAAWDAAWDAAQDAAWDAARDAAWAAARDAAQDAAWAAARAAARAAAWTKQAILLRDITGDPFADSPQLDRSRLTLTAIQLAQSAYDKRDWPALPIIADALEDAGWDQRELHDAMMLHHLREGGPHARGCWVLDLILGKK